MGDQTWRRCKRCRAECDTARWPDKCGACATPWSGGEREISEPQNEFVPERGQHDLDDDSVNALNQEVRKQRANALGDEHLASGPATAEDYLHHAAWAMRCFEEQKRKAGH